MRTTRILAGLASVLVASLACAPGSEPVSVAPDVPEELRGCLEGPEVQRYLARLRERTLEVWQLPEGVAPGQDVRILFSLRTDGHLRGTIIADALTQEIEDSAVRALEAAAPFAPLEDATACLARVPLSASFRNPVEP